MLPSLRPVPWLVLAVLAVPCGAAEPLVADYAVAAAQVKSEAPIPKLCERHGELQTLAFTLSVQPQGGTAKETRFAFASCDEAAFSQVDTIHGGDRVWRFAERTYRSASGDTIVILSGEGELSEVFLRGVPSNGRPLEFDSVMTARLAGPEPVRLAKGYEMNIGFGPAFPPEMYTQPVVTLTAQVVP